MEGRVLKVCQGCEGCCGAAPHGERGWGQGVGGRG